MDKSFGVPNKIIRSLPYYQAKGITRKKMLQTVDAATLRQFGRSNLDYLRQRAEELPANN